MSNFNTGEVVKEAKQKRQLINMKPTALPESHNPTPTVLPEKQVSNNNGLTVLPEKQKAIKKVKITVYVTEESWETFNTIYAKRLIEKRKTDKGDLMSEAIELLKEKENQK